MRRKDDGAPGHADERVRDIHRATRRHVLAELKIRSRS